MHQILQTDSSSTTFRKFPINFEMETSYYIKQSIVSPRVEKKESQRNLAETSTVLRIIGCIDLLKDVYLLKEAKQIESYLWRNSILLDFLCEAHTQIINIFGFESQLSLELHRDYEENFEELFIVIKSLAEPSRMIELLDKLDDEWFLNVSDNVHGKLNITVESL